MAQTTSSRNITIRPPNLSVHMPSGRRNRAPVSTGVEVSKPNSTPFRPSSRLIGIPVTPNISHTAKQTTNAHVVTAKTTKLLGFDMVPPIRVARSRYGLAPAHKLCHQIKQQPTMYIIAQSARLLFELGQDRKYPR